MALYRHFDHVPQVQVVLESYQGYVPSRQHPDRGKRLSGDFAKLENFSL